MCIHSDVRTFIDEQKAETLEDAARLADEFSLSHKVTFAEKPKRPYPTAGQDPPPTPRWFGNQRSHQSEDPRRKQNPSNNSANRSNFSWSRQNKTTKSKPFKTLTCFYCRRDGHMIPNCPEKLKMARQQHNAESKPTGFVATSLSLPDVREGMPTKSPDVKTQSSLISEVSVTPQPVMNVFEPLIHEGSVSLCSDLSDAVSVKILRDTGATQTLLLANTLPFSKKSSNGASVLIKGVNCSEYAPVPLHRVYLSSDLVSGPFIVELSSSLPFKGVQLLLGNDLAGDKVVVNPNVTDVPCVEQLPDPVEKETRNRYPACAETCAKSEKNSSNENAEVDQADTFMIQVFEKAVVEAEDKASEVRKEAVEYDEPSTENLAVETTNSSAENRLKTGSPVMSEPKDEKGFASN